MGRNNDNLKQFHTTVVSAYQAQKRAGNIPAQTISVYNKLVACPQVVSVGKYGNRRRVHAHRQWRRAVARMYRRDTGQPVGLDWSIDWTSIVEWVMENIIPILRLMLTIVPFLV
jgi:hypothetical protein